MGGEDESPNSCECRRTWFKCFSFFLLSFKIDLFLKTTPSFCLQLDGKKEHIRASSDFQFGAPQTKFLVQHTQRHKNPRGRCCTKFHTCMFSYSAILRGSAVSYILHEDNNGRIWGFNFTLVYYSCQTNSGSYFMHCKLPGRSHVDDFKVQYHHLWGQSFLWPPFLHSDDVRQTIKWGLFTSCVSSFHLDLWTDITVIWTDFNVCGIRTKIRGWIVDLYWTVKRGKFLKGCSLWWLSHIGAPKQYSCCKLPTVIPVWCAIGVERMSLAPNAGNAKLEGNKCNVPKDHRWQCWNNFHFFCWNLCQSPN